MAELSEANSHGLDGQRLLLPYVPQETKTIKVRLIIMLTNNLTSLNPSHLLRLETHGKMGKTGDKLDYYWIGFANVQFEISLMSSTLCTCTCTVSCKVSKKSIGRVQNSVV